MFVFGGLMVGFIGGCVATGYVFIMFEITIKIRDFKKQPKPIAKPKVVKVGGRKVA